MTVDLSEFAFLGGLVGSQGAIGDVETFVCAVYDVVVLFFVNQEGFGADSWIVHRLMTFFNEYEPFGCCDSTAVR